MPVIHDLYSPTFLAEAPIVDAEPASPARADAASDGDWTYNPQRHGAFEAFFRHADFPPFRERVERNIDDLIAFARAGDLRGAVPHLEALRNKLFDIGLDGHPLSVKPYEVIKSYGPLVESLDRLVPLFHDETMRLESRRTELQRLAPELPVCANGALNAVQSALIQLELKRSGLGGKFRATVEHIVEQAATDAVEIKYQRDFHLAHLEQRHYVAGLKSKLYQLEIQKRNLERDKIEAGKMKIDFGSQIRNYVLHPYKLVKDARTGVESHDAQSVLDGDLDDFIKAFLLGAQEQPQQA